MLFKERLKEKLLAEESVDFVCGPDAYRDLPRLVSSILESLQSSGNNRQKAANTLLSIEETYADIRPVRVFVSLLQFSFCVVRI